jgi:hypothetical protein
MATRDSTGATSPTLPREARQLIEAQAALLAHYYSTLESIDIHMAAQKLTRPDWMRDLIRSCSAGQDDVSTLAEHVCTRYRFGRRDRTNMRFVRVGELALDEIPRLKPDGSTEKLSFDPDVLEHRAGLAYERLSQRFPSLPPAAEA